MTGQEFKTQAAEVVAVCKKMGFMDYEIFPYGFRMTVKDFVRNWPDYDICTADSRAIMRDELRGFLPILEHWVAYEQEPFVRVRIITGPKAGELMDYHESTAQVLINAGIAEGVA